MSLLNVWVSDARALVAVDTSGMLPDGSTHHGSKLYFLPHSQFIIAGRGILAFSRLIFDICHAHNLGWDDAVENFAKIEQFATKQIKEAADRDGMSGRVDLTSQELALVGWSNRQGRFCGIWVRRDPNAADFVDSPIDPWVCAPYANDWGDPPDCDMSTQAGMETMARWQLPRCREKFPGQPIGGKLLLAEITSGNVTIKTQCDLPSKPAIIATRRPA